MLLFTLTLMNVAPANAFFVGDTILLDSDDKSGRFTRAGVALSKKSDGYPYADFYRLDVSLACLSTTHLTDGPLQVEVNVFLPPNVEDVELYTRPYGFYSQIQSYNPIEIRPEIEKLQNSCLVKWSFSSVKLFVAADWLFIDYVRFYLDFEVPENMSVTAYVAVATAYYSFNILSYHKISDERIQWLQVKSHGEEQFEPETPKLKETPALILTPIGLNSILGACIATVATLHYAINKEKHKNSPRNQQSSKDLQKPRRPLGVIIIAIFNLLLAVPLCLVLGIANVNWRPALATNLITFGILNIITSLGLLTLKTWSWYTSITINTLSIINNYILFPTSNTIIIPLEPFIIAYLLIRRSSFQIP